MIRCVMFVQYTSTMQFHGHPEDREDSAAPASDVDIH